jgi:HAE1 family hydrophobic/amphiphilic exporter-1/multidrug efflux pump
VLTALILTPALCASLLKPHDPNQTEGDGIFARFSRWFNTTFDRGRERYERGIRYTAENRKRSMFGYALIVLVMALLFWRLPSGFLPDEDQGYAVAIVQGPAGATSARTEKALTMIREHFLGQESKNVFGVFTLNGFSFAGSGQNSGIAFIPFKSWEERKGGDNRAASIAQRGMGAFSQYRDGLVFAIVPPPVQELGNATGFDLQLVDTTGIGHARLLQARNMLLGMASQDKRVAGVRPNSLEDAPALKIEVDQDKMRALGLDLAQVNSTIAGAWGGQYVNDFIDRGRVKRVYLQADAPYRLTPEDLGKFYVRGADGQMTPYTAFTTISWEQAPVQLTRYNGQPAMELLGVPAPGESSGTALKAMQEMQAKLPPGTSLEWTGLSYEERQSGGQAPALYGLSLLVVFLCLAALYESWSVPVSVMLVVPLGVVGAVLAATLTGLTNDIYLQVGLITTIGVSAKNAILIVEFAQEKMREGAAPFDAAIEAAKLRLRPILMTSLAFVFGVFPLAIATGAGAGGQNAIGRAVVGGMLSATILAIFFVPVFFVLVLGLFKKRGNKERTVQDDGTGEPAAQGA